MNNKSIENIQTLVLGEAKKKKRKPPGGRAPGEEYIPPSSTKPEHERRPVGMRKNLQGVTPAAARPEDHQINIGDFVKTKTDPAIYGTVTKIDWEQSEQPSDPVNVGDQVQWAPDGRLMWREPKTITRIVDGAEAGEGFESFAGQKFAFTDDADEPGAVPVSQLQHWDTSDHVTGSAVINKKNQPAKVWVKTRDGTISKFYYNQLDKVETKQTVQPGAQAVAGDIDRAGKTGDEVQIVVGDIVKGISNPDIYGPVIHVSKTQGTPGRPTGARDEPSVNAIVIKGYPRSFKASDLKVVKPNVQKGYQHPRIGTSNIKMGDTVQHKTEKNVEGRVIKLDSKGSEKYAYLDVYKKGKERQPWPVKDLLVVEPHGVNTGLGYDGAGSDKPDEGPVMNMLNTVHRGMNWIKVLKDWFTNVYDTPMEGTKYFDEGGKSRVFGKVTRSPSTGSPNYFEFLHEDLKTKQLLVLYGHSHKKGKNSGHALKLNVKHIIPEGEKDLHPMHGAPLPKELQDMKRDLPDEDRTDGWAARQRTMHELEMQKRDLVARLEGQGGMNSLEESKDSIYRLVEGHSYRSSRDIEDDRRNKHRKKLDKDDPRYKSEIQRRKEIRAQGEGPAKTGHQLTGEEPDTWVTDVYEDELPKSARTIPESEDETALAIRDDETKLAIQRGDIGFDELVDMPGHWDEIPYEARAAMAVQFEFDGNVDSGIQALIGQINLLKEQVFGIKPGNIYGWFVKSDPGDAGSNWKLIRKPGNKWKVLLKKQPWIDRYPPIMDIMRQWIPDELPEEILNDPEKLSEFIIVNYNNTAEAQGSEPMTSDMVKFVAKTVTLKAHINTVEGARKADSRGSSARTRGRAAQAKLNTVNQKISEVKDGAKERGTARTSRVKAKVKALEKQAEKLVDQVHRHATNAVKAEAETKEALIADDSAPESLHSDIAKMGEESLPGGARGPRGSTQDTLGGMGISRGGGRAQGGGKVAGQTSMTPRAISARTARAKVTAAKNRSQGGGKIAGEISTTPKAVAARASRAAAKSGGSGGSGGSTSGGPTLGLTGESVAIITRLVNGT